MNSHLDPLTRIKLVASSLKEELSLAVGTINYALDDLDKLIQATQSLSTLNEMPSQKEEEKLTLEQQRISTEKQKMEDLLQRYRAKTAQHTLSIMPYEALSLLFKQHLSIRRSDCECDLCSLYPKGKDNK